MPELDADFEISTNNLEAEYEISEGEHFDCSFEIYAAGATFSNIAGSPYDNEALASALNQKADNSTVEALSETVDSNYNTLDGKIDTHIADKTNPHEVTKAQVGLGNVDNTSDLNKPISTATQTALNGKQNTINDLSEIRSNASNGQSAYNTIQNYGDIVTYDASSFATSVQGQKADTALQPNDDISELVNDIGYITMSALGDYATLQELENGLATKQDTINDLSDIRNDASKGANAYTTIQTYGDIVTYNASSFATSAQGALASTALQPNDNITELNNNAGYITSASLPTVNNNKITIQKNSTDVGSFTLNQSTDKTINLPIPTQASDINAVPTSRKVNNKALSSDITLSASDVSALPSSTTINDLTTSTQQDALNSGATSTNIGQIATNTSDITAIEGLIPVQATTTNQLADKSFVNSSIATNTAYFIGTFNSVADLEAYSGTLTNNDYAFVETTDSAGNTLYDRYKYTTATTPASWQFEYELNNSSFTSNQWASINSGITANDVTLIGTAIQPNDNVSSLTNDAGYITSSSLPTVNNGTLTIQQNGTDVQTFTANQSTNVTANITVPTKTSDLTNNSGFIDNSALSSYATQTDLTNGLATKQDTISDLSTIRSNAANGQSAYTTIGGYGDIVTYNASGFVQKNGGSSTQVISLTSGTGTTPLNIKSMSTSSYLSLSGSSGWLGSYGVSSGKRAMFYNGTGYTLAYTSELPTKTSDLTNDSGYITGIGSSDVITALGYTPYDSSNPNGYTSNIGTVTSVNNIQPDANGNVTISSGSSTDVQINGTSITSGGVANILTNSAYSSSNKIATMSDVPSTSGLANTDLSNLSNTGNAKFQAPLISGTNIKTINNTSILGSGDISVGSYSAGTGLSLSGTEFNHSNSVTAGTIGTSSATSGSTISVPYATYDAQGHITAKGTHTHTVTGFLTSSSSEVASTRFDGQWVFKYKIIQTTTSTGYRSYNLGTSGTGALSYLPSDCTTYKYEVACMLSGNSSSSSYASIASTATDITKGIYGRIHTNSNARVDDNAFIVVVTNGMIYVNISENAFNSSFAASVTGYRRIGTNS